MAVRIRRLRAGVLAGMVMMALGTTPARAAETFLGRWNVRIVDDVGPFAAGGFAIEEATAGLRGEVVWRFGSVVPVRGASVKNGVLQFDREETAGKVDHFEARLEGGGLRGEVRYADGTAHRFLGRRAPDLPAAAAVQWGEPQMLFDGTSLAGWSLRDPKAKMGWAVVDGTLAVVEPKGNADLVSERKFQDLKLHLEFNLEPKSNSGAYLRGRYEIQILDDATKATEAHGCGAVYSRIAPRLDATRPAGEWQSFDLTLVGRRLTVVLNGKTVIENALVDGITGGAMSPFEGEPGPLMLQGDHGKVRFRNIVVTPAR